MAKDNKFIKRKPKKSEFQDQREFEAAQREFKETGSFLKKSDAARKKEAEKRKERALSRNKKQEGITFNPPEDNGDTATSDTSGDTDTSGDSLQDRLDRMEQKIGELGQGKEKLISDISERIKEQPSTEKTLRQFYGDVGNLSSLVNPAEAKQLAQQRARIQQEMDNLGKEFEQRYSADVPQSRVSAEKRQAREELSDQLSAVSEAEEAQRGAFSQATQLASKFSEARQEDLKQPLEAMEFELKNRGFNQGEIGAIAQRMKDAYSLAEEQTQQAGKTQRKQIGAQRDIQEQRITEQGDLSEQQLKQRQETGEELRKGIEEARDLAVESGVSPDKFADVARVAEARFQRGEPVSVIEEDVYRAVGDNPRVKEFLQTRFDKAKADLARKQQLAGGGGTGGGTGGSGELAEVEQKYTAKEVKDLFGMDLGPGSEGKTYSVEYTADGRVKSIREEDMSLAQQIQQSAKQMGGDGGGAKQKTQTDTTQTQEQETEEEGGGVFDMSLSDIFSFNEQEEGATPSSFGSKNFALRDAATKSFF